jgi:glutaconate CoA-transferase subunit A
MKSKLVSIPSAAAHVASGQTVALGGSLLRRQPMALVHEIIRNGVTDLSLLSWASSLATDMLVGAGAVTAWEGIYAGMWWNGLAPNFRRAAEQGNISVRDQSESFMTARFRAAAMGVPFLPLRPIRGTSMSVRNDIQDVVCPYTGQILQAVAAARPDVTVLHGYVGDEYGNVAWPVHRDSDDLDLILAAGSTKLIVSVERIVAHEEITRYPNLTYIPHIKVDAICEAAFGAYPGSCDTSYDEDEAEIERWVRSSESASTFDGYLEANVRRIADHSTFLNRLGQERMSELKVGNV